jgi:hypothetical protein
LFATAFRRDEVWGSSCLAAKHISQPLKIGLADWLIELDASLSLILPDDSAKQFNLSCFEQHILSDPRQPHPVKPAARPGDVSEQSHPGLFN